MSVAERTRIRPGTLVLLCVGVALLFGWSLLPESANVPPRDGWDGDDERVVQLYVQSTYPRIGVQAAGTSTVRGKILDVDGNFARVWSAEVRLRYGESATFVVTADINVGGTGAEHALQCQIFENNKLAAPDDRAETTRKEGRASVLCKYTSTG